jgi:hypothetical protein
VTATHSADEQMFFPSDCRSLKQLLNSVVFQRQTTRPGLTTQCRPLINRVREHLPDLAPGNHSTSFHFTINPRFEVLQNRKRMVITSRRHEVTSALQVGTGNDTNMKEL